jgi:hypothetical protein
MLSSSLAQKERENERKREHTAEANSVSKLGIFKLVADSELQSIEG